MTIALIYVDMLNRLTQPGLPTLNSERRRFPRPMTFDFAAELADFREFGTALGQHEARENALLQRVYNEDLGERD